MENEYTREDIDRVKNFLREINKILNNPEEVEQVEEPDELTKEEQAIIPTGTLLSRSR